MGSPHRACNKVVIASTIDDVAELPKKSWRGTAERPLWVKVSERKGSGIAITAL
jgi:hypothetical protein